MTLLGVAGVLAIVVPVVAKPPGTENFNKSGDTASEEDCGEGNALVIHHPTALWPPNHKYYDDIYVLATDEQGQSIELESHGYHDQYDTDTGAEQNGAGNTGDDITVNDDDASVMENETDEGYPQVVAMESDDGEVQTDWRARAERSGRDQTGRDYSMGATATFSDGQCSVDVTFGVPHDMRKSNRS